MNYHPDTNGHPQPLTHEQWDALSLGERNLLWEHSPGSHPLDRAPNLGINNFGPTQQCTSPYCRPPDGEPCPGYHLVPRSEDPPFGEEYRMWQQWAREQIRDLTERTRAQTIRRASARKSRAASDPQYTLPDWAEAAISADRKQHPDQWAECDATDADNAARFARREEIRAANAALAAARALAASSAAP